MQIGTEQLKAQQTIMQNLNYYTGKIDGIWGPKTIAAKVKWERSGKFSPAIPNNGFPLAERASLPPGVTRTATGLLVHVASMPASAKPEVSEPAQVLPETPAATAQVLPEGSATPTLAATASTQHQGGQVSGNQNQAGQNQGNKHKQR